MSGAGHDEELASIPCARPERRDARRRVAAVGGPRSSRELPRGVGLAVAFDEDAVFGAQDRESVAAPDEQRAAIGREHRVGREHVGRDVVGGEGDDPAIVETEREGPIADPEPDPPIVSGASATCR
ncbi:hypothetical protein [Nannocystis exedens]|uniref:hypothetical protein n=1 Tax=Nannocystis exedens TaxID=54 RepID=UPI001160421A|nr:hypothetical protein [Nannocystis exedens]